MKIPFSPLGRGRPATEPSETAAFLAAARRAEPWAVFAMYDQHHDRLRRLARRILGEHAAAEDLVQDVFERLPSALRQFRGDSSLATFLFSMVANRAMHHLRSTIRRRRTLARLASEPQALSKSGTDRDARVRELAAELVRALDKLPLEQRMAFVLCEVEELTSPEAAALTGIPEATVRTRLFHARRRLRELLRPDLFEC